MTVKNNCSLKNGLGWQVLSLMAIFVSAIGLQATTYNWTGSSSTLWSTATNWSPAPASAPGFGDTTLFGVTNAITRAVTDLGGGSVTVGSSSNANFYASLFSSNAVFQYTVNGATSSYTLTNGTVTLGTSASTPSAAFLIGSGVTLNLNATINSGATTPAAIPYAVNNNAVLNIGSSASCNGRFYFEPLTNGVTATANVNAANFASTANGRWQIGGTPSGANKQANVTVNLNANEGLNTSGYLTIGDVAPGYEAKLVVRSNAWFTERGRVQLGGQGLTAAGNGRLVIGDTTPGYFTNDLTGAGASTIWLKIGAIQNSTGIVDVVNGTFAYPNNGGQGITTQYLPFATSNNAAAMINLYTNGTFSTVVNFAKNTAVFGTVSASFNFYGGTLQADPQINAVQGNNLLDANLPVFVYNGGAILDNNGKAMTINAALQNPGGSTGGLLLIGSGTTTLNGTNGLAGVTLVKQGTLALSSGFGSPSTIVVSNGATLGFNAGTLASNPNVTVADGGAIGSLLTSGGTAMTVSTLTLGTTSSGGIVNIQFGGGGNDSFTVSGTNGLTLNGGRINVYVEGTTSPFSTPGTYTIFNYSGTDAGSTNHLVVNNPADGATYAFNDTGSSIQLIIGVNSSLNQWGVDADGNWSQLSNWTLLIPNNSANSALFGSFITNPHTVTADANFTVKQIEFANNNSYTINGPGVITLSGSTNAVVDASIGSHVVNAGLALATNTLFSAAASQTITLAGNIAGSSSFQVSTNNLGTIAITGTNVAPVTVNAGSLTITGSGELTQPLTVLGGTAWIDGEANLGPNPPTLNTNQLLLNGGTLRSTGTASISNTNRGITLGTNGGSFGSASGVYTLTINNSIGGSGSLTKTFGSQGTVILAANNTYAGGTIVNYGDLQVGTGGTVGNLGTGANVTINNGSYLDLDRSDLTSLSNNFAIGTGGGCIRNLAAPSITLTGSFNDQTNNYLTLDTQGGNFIFPGDRVTNFYGVIETNGHSVTLTGNLTAGTTYGRIQVAGGTVAVASGANWTFTNNVTTRTIFVGAAGGLGGSMYVSNGAVLNVTGVSVGNANNSADSSFELDGGTVNLLGTAGDVVYLHEAGQSDNGYTMTVNSGTLNVPDPGSRFDIGFKGGATFTVNGGIVSLSRAGFGAVGSTITTSYALGGIGMNSAFIINGGSVNVSNQLELCSDQTANAGVYRVNTISVNSGGTLRTVAANLTTLAATPNIEFDLNGGTLVALGAGGYGGSLGNFLGGVGTVTVGPNSTINDGGYSMAITNALLDNGGGSLTKLGIGTLALNGANTYTGSTLVSNGTLGGNGSIAGSLSVSGGGTLSPGAGIGTFTVGGNAALSGETLMELNKTNAPTTNDLLVVTGTLTGGGTLIVTNLGPALVAGDTFKLFSKPVSGFTSISLPSGYNWTTNLASNGSITVQSVISSTPPTLSVTQTGSTLNFTWSDVSFHLQSQTNALNAGLSTNWSNYPGGGSSPVNITINPANPAVFFRLSQ